MACHQFDLLERLDVLGCARDGATVLLDSPYGRDGTWQHLPREAQEIVIERHLNPWAIDARRVARAAGLGGRINTVMQACFFALSGVLPKDEALRHVKEATARAYAKKGPDVVARNIHAIEHALEHLQRIEVPAEATGRARPPVVPAAATQLVERATAEMLAGRGALLPVSAFAPDGTWPVGTARWEKRNLADEIPAWAEELCIQCNTCVLACPHAAIRAKVVEPALLDGAPEGFKSMPWAGTELAGLRYVLQVAPEDCTGCRACVEICPAKDRGNRRRKALGMVAQRPLREAEAARFDFFVSLPELDRERVPLTNKGSQLFVPLVECGVWPLYTVDPARLERGEPALHVDAGAHPKRRVRDYALNEMRFRIVQLQDPERFERLQAAAQQAATRRMEVYRQLAEIRVGLGAPSEEREPGGR